MTDVDDAVSFALAAHALRTSELEREASLLRRRSDALQRQLSEAQDALRGAHIRRDDEFAQLDAMNRALLSDLSEKTDAFEKLRETMDAERAAAQAAMPTRGAQTSPTRRSPCRRCEARAATAPDAGTLAAIHAEHRRELDDIARENDAARAAAVLAERTRAEATVAELKEHHARIVDAERKAAMSDAGAQRDVLDAKLKAERESFEFRLESERAKVAQEKHRAAEARMMAEAGMRERDERIAALQATLDQRGETGREVLARLQAEVEELRHDKAAAVSALASFQETHRVEVRRLSDSLKVSLEESESRWREAVVTEQNRVRELEEELKVMTEKHDAQRLQFEKDQQRVTREMLHAEAAVAKAVEAKEAAEDSRRKLASLVDEKERLHAVRQEQWSTALRGHVREIGALQDDNRRLREEITALQERSEVPPTHIECEEERKSLEKRYEAQISELSNRHNLDIRRLQAQWDEQRSAYEITEASLHRRLTELEVANARRGGPSFDASAVSPLRSAVAAIPLSDAGMSKVVGATPPPADRRGGSAHRTAWLSPDATAQRPTDSSPSPLRGEDVVEAASLLSYLRRR